jgi:hypothetical protein
MKRTSFAVTLVVVLISGVALGRNGRVRIEKKSDEVRLSLLSSQISWETETKYVMQWDERSKRLLFDGLLASPRVVKPQFHHYAHYNITNPDSMPPIAPDEHSFDAGTVGRLANLSESKKSDGRLHYHIQWDDSKETFVFHKIHSELFAVSKLDTLWKAHNAEVFYDFK